MHNAVVLTNSISILYVLKSAIKQTNYECLTLSPIKGMEFDSGFKALKITSDRE